MRGIDPPRVAQELVEQKKLDGLTNLFDAFSVIREFFGVSDVELLQVLRELRVVHGVIFDRNIKFDGDSDTSKNSGTNWIIPVPNALP